MTLPGRKRPPSTTVPATLLMLVAAGIWGSAFYFQKTAMGDLSPLWFLGLRGVVAAVALLPFAVWEQRHSGKNRGRVLRFGAGAGLLFLVAGWMQQHGLITATVTNTGFLTSLYVVATPIVLWLATGQRPGRVVLLAAAIALAGTWAIGGGGWQSLGSGDWWILASTLLWGGLIVLTGTIASAEQPLTYTLAQFGTLALVALPLALAQGLPSSQALLAAVPELLFVGVLSSALTFAIMAIALRDLSAPHAAILLSTEVLFSAAAGHLLLDERLPPLGWLGAALILVSVLLVHRHRPTSP